MPGSIPMVSPGVRVNEIDQSSYTPLPTIPTNAIGIVGFARFGPIDTPTVLTSVSQFEKTFGTPIDNAGLAAVKVLNAGGTVYYTRAAGDSAAKMSTNLYGNLKIEGKYKGTLTDGTINAVVSDSDTTDSDIVISVISMNPDGSSETIVSESTVSLDPNSENYIENWNNELFEADYDPGSTPAYLIGYANSGTTITRLGEDTNPNTRDGFNAQMVCTDPDNDASLYIWADRAVPMLNVGQTIKIKVNGSLKITRDSGDPSKFVFGYAVKPSESSDTTVWNTLKSYSTGSINDVITIKKSDLTAWNTSNPYLWTFYFRFEYARNTESSANITVKADNLTIPSITPGMYVFNGGNDGYSTTMTNNIAPLNKAAMVFSDSESYPLMYLSSPGYSTNQSIADTLVTIAKSRKDLVAQIDCPNQSDLESLINALKPYTGDNNSFVALWAGVDGFVIDPYNNNAEVLVPVSVYLLPALAALYADNPVWMAPAGIGNLRLTELTRLDKIWTQADRDKLYAANINPILNYRGLGYTALGQKTAQTKMTSLDRLNVRQLVNHIKRQIEGISVDFLFAPIDDETFSNWTYRVSNFLTGIKQAHGLYDFIVKMDWETVTPDAVNNNLMPAVVKIKPTKVAEFIDVDLIIKNYSDTL